MGFRDNILVLKALVLFERTSIFILFRTYVKLIWKECTVHKSCIPVTFRTFIVFDSQSNATNLIIVIVVALFLRFSC